MVFQKRGEKVRRRLPPAVDAQTTTTTAYTTTMPTTTAFIGDPMFPVINGTAISLKTSPRITVFII
jgi:hypothetical protein